MFIQATAKCRSLLFCRNFPERHSASETEYCGVIVTQ